MSGEIWKDIAGYEGCYQVSNLGNVRNVKTSRVLKGRLDMYGYCRVILYKKGAKYKSFQIHRLVATAFIPNPENKPQVDHANTVRADNRLDNLRWVTYHENNMNPLTREKFRTNYRYSITGETRRKMSESAKKRIRLPASEETKKNYQPHARRGGRKGNSVLTN